ncbi:nickel pincer cofactor biosynthesis protein LarC [Clostridium fungisolvens]|uniref:Pyridinium-3,5-bisthiocarboxylic acid mononucleotide nickel insertion protein n=1 Tax=Clostridium fungisolvens TaxID=1604897 RepID=A0A6V8SGA3_9CLOT|nr:nickel pincer cofactor biosynthesis protein LarC [Clostridium fungisolvens]GFP76070.1 Pyridinium-3,5-bisthiocarboxylic acid mononucleotide nickel insertion protein [Clostridium fungisolvens]
MKILYYDCFCGISGDMNLGALIDLGVDKEYLLNEIAKLNISSEYGIDIRKDIKNGITGTKVDVIIKKQDNHNHVHIDEEHHDKTHTHTHELDQDFHHEHHNHHHNHMDEQHSHEDLNIEENKTHHHHEHRNFNDIKNIISSSELSDKVKSLSLAIFMRIAEAEAEVHGKTIDEVHFHEVGAIDSIIDIVGAAVALDYLKVDKIMASPIQLGGGFVKCAHGLIPVPAPATIRILKNIPVRTGIVNFETTTPTGAAILAENVEVYTDKTEFSIEKIGYGLGTRELEIPNVLRVYLGEEIRNEDTEEQHLLETNIDDMNPEIYSYVEEKLFESGALDVFKTPIIMKKGRPAIKLSVLVNKKVEKKILEVIFKETTSIGVRKFDVEKIMLNREFSKVSTNYGEVTVKNSYYNGELVKSKPEYEDCKRLAKEKNVPISKIYNEVYKTL